ncbi:MAG: glycoside hydrolase family 97 protein [Sphingobacteriales bacterium]|nr:glycoside hydrolase family 97 protein [Sphingobacteriales bacterium]
MAFKKAGIFLLCAAFFQPAMAQSVKPTKPITVNMGKVKLTFSIEKNGKPDYAVTYNQKPVVKPSQLGFRLANDNPLTANFELIGAENKTVNDSWQPVWGEVNKIQNNYKQLTVHLKQKVTNRLLNIVFKVFADGVGFRYEFPKQPSLKYFIVTDELTQFNMAGDHKSFWIPGDYDTNEYPYTTSKLSEIDNKALADKSTDITVRSVFDRFSVQTPLMMKSSDGLYINIHEAALVNYPAMQLQHEGKGKEYQLSASLVPDALGNKAYLHAPFNTPWRTIVVSDDAKDILASKMILNLNEPSKIANSSWVKPMKFAGVWWEMQTGKGTWSYSDFPDSLNAKGQLIPNKKHSANTDNVKHYIDFAAENGIPAVLVEGWNTGWEDSFGSWTPYPDFDVKALQAYAKAKGVQIIMHNETCGAVTNYERQMDTAFAFMKHNGYSAVKTGYVGKIIPRGEHHDGQWMVNHYQRSIEKAAASKVMIDIHEPNRPTGLHRTYPNFMASEAGRGNEYHAFSNGCAPDHVTILPFTRLMGGPMDYTPGLFKLRNYTADTTKKVLSTIAKQLALYVTVYSPFQMVADLPENYYAHTDAFQFIKEVAVDWDDTKILAAEPGDYVAIARKEKGANKWFIGAVTDENKKDLEVELSFLNKGESYVATVYADAADADYETNPEAYKIAHFIVNSNSKLKLAMARGGGAAVSILPIIKLKKN